MGPEDILLSKETGLLIRCIMIKLAIQCLKILDKPIPQ